MLVQSLYRSEYMKLSKILYIQKSKNHHRLHHKLMSKFLGIHPGIRLYRNQHIHLYRNLDNQLNKYQRNFLNKYHCRNQCKNHRIVLSSSLNKQLSNRTNNLLCTVPYKNLRSLLYTVSYKCLNILIHNFRHILKHNLLCSLNHKC